MYLIGICYGGDFITFTYSGRANKLWIPEGYNGQALPLYVMLHGCTQDPTDFSKGTKMNTYGDQYNLFVLYPLQPTSANSNKCWNWFETSDQARGSGEPALIAGMVGSVMDQYNIDADRVYVGGLSAGAAMAVIMGVTYPDIFAAVAVGAGLEYKSATSTISAYTAMSSGGPDPLTQGQLGYKAGGKYVRLQGVMVIHGTSDYTVAYKNGEQVITSYARTLDLVHGGGSVTGSITDTPASTESGKVSGGYSYTIENYINEDSGQLLLKFVTVTSMGHAWSGGSTEGTYTDPKGPDASLLMIQFFSSFPSDPVSTTGALTTGQDTTTGSDTSGGSGTTGDDTTGGDTTTGDSTTGTPTNQVTLYAIADESGYAGQLVADGYGTICQLGTKGFYNSDTYRAFLSFDTSDIPSGVNIRSAVLTIFRKDLSGDLGTIYIDAKNGYFGTSPKVQQSDWGAAADVVSAAEYPIPASNGASSSIDLPSSVVDLLSPEAARIQFRFLSVGARATYAPILLEFYVDDSNYAATLTVSYD